MKTPTPWLLLALTTAGCLDSTDEDVIPLDVLLGDPADADEFTELPDYDRRADEFTRNVDYLRGFAEGAPVWYWNVDGANSNLIAPFFVVVDGQGARLDQPIVDVIPGDPGYTPWWRRVEYRITDRWNGEIFTSREAVDAGERAGLLEGPITRETVLNAPVSAKEVIIDDGIQAVNRTVQIWYRGTRAYWIPFPQNLSVPLDRRTMPDLPVYIFQRINEAIPLYEFGSGVDVTNDQKLDDSNNLFAVNLDNPEYTPLWTRGYVRTTAEYRSIDTNPPERNVDISGESQFYDRGSETILTSSVVDVRIDLDALVNCPIQSERGVFP